MLDILCGVMMGWPQEQLDRDFLFPPLASLSISHLISPLFLICHLLSSRFLPSPPQLLLHHIHFFLSSLLFRLPAQSKVTPDLRLPLPPAAMLNNAAE